MEDTGRSNFADLRRHRSMSVSSRGRAEVFRSVVFQKTNGLQRLTSARHLHGADKRGQEELLTKNKQNHTLSQYINAGSLKPSTFDIAHSLSRSLPPALLYLRRSRKCRCGSFEHQKRNRERSSSKKGCYHVVAALPRCRLLHLTVVAGCSHLLDFQGMYTYHDFNPGSDLLPRICDVGYKFQNPYYRFLMLGISHHGRLSPRTKLISTRVKFNFNVLPPISSLDGVSIDLSVIASRAESLMYTLVDAAVAVDSVASVSGDSATTTVQKSGGWFGFISDAMEVVLKVATLPLTKQQVESTLAMQNLQPKLKAIQQRYAGNKTIGVSEYRRATSTPVNDNPEFEPAPKR
ncbi:hypothetical protein LXL04_032571 [Taraxacum kok-saghyz]